MKRKVRPKGRHLLVEERSLVFELLGSGMPVRKVAGLFNCAETTVYGMLDRRGESRRGAPDWSDNPRRLSLADREEIRVGIARGDSFREIARRLGRSASTISREVNRNGGRCGYVAFKAHRRARRMVARPKPGKLRGHRWLRRRVMMGLIKKWSPEQISRCLRLAFPDDESMRISPETIYKSLYVQARGELRKDLARNLRTGRTSRKSRGKAERRGRIPGMVMISERPPEADSRAVPGHWEGDLLIGKNGKSAIGTLVERKTRFLMLVALGGDRTTEVVCEKIGQKILELPEPLHQSLTWDQGREMADHVCFSKDTRIPVYFCDPHSPWQRGSNENTNGLLRQYLPKGTDLAVHGQVELDLIATQLNNRPRKTLDFKTPNEKIKPLMLR